MSQLHQLINAYLERCNNVRRLCVAQFGSDHGIGHYSARPHWRNDASGAGQTTKTWDEIHRVTRKARELALSWPHHDENTLGDLVERLQDGVHRRRLCRAEHCQYHQYGQCLLASRKSPSGFEHVRACYDWPRFSPVDPWEVRYGYVKEVVGGHSTEEIVGPAYVIDGDTIEIQREHIRFYGIDAPEASQQCSDATGTSYRCGQKSTVALDDMVRGKTVRCDRRDTDRYGRAVAICTANGTDLNAALVEAGLAVAYRHFSRIYVRNEESARQAHRGLWAGSFEMPWDYRRSGR